MQQRREPATPLRLNFNSPIFPMLLFVSATPVIHNAFLTAWHPHLTLVSPYLSWVGSRKTRVPGLLGGHAIHHPFRWGSSQNPFKTIVRLWYARVCTFKGAKLVLGRQLFTLFSTCALQSTIFGQFDKLGSSREPYPLSLYDLRGKNAK